MRAAPTRSPRTIFPHMILDPMGTHTFPPVRGGSPHVVSRRSAAVDAGPVEPGDLDRHRRRIHVPARSAFVSTVDIAHQHAAILTARVGAVFVDNGVERSRLSVVRDVMP